MTFQEARKYRAQLVRDGKTYNIKSTYDKYKVNTGKQGPRCTWALWPIEKPTDCY